MPAKHYRGYYEGFANSALWPALHSRPDLIQVTADEYASYREVNAFMARALLRFIATAAAVMGAGLSFLDAGRRAAPARYRRARSASSCTRRGRPPHHDAAVPHHADLVSAMLAYDLIGFQTDDDRRNFEDYLQLELGLPVTDGEVTSHYGRHAAGHLPDRHRRRRIRRTRHESDAHARKLRDCVQACRAPSSRSVSTGSIIRKAWPTACARSAACLISSRP